MRISPRSLLGVCTFAAASLSTPQAQATLGGVQALPELAASAQLIVVAELDEVPIPGRDLQLHVRRVLKGEGTVSLVRARWPQGLATSDPPQPLHGVWFLNADGDRWTVLPPIQSVPVLDDLFIRVPAGDLPGPYQYAAGDPVLDKLVQELRAALAGDEGASSQSRLYEELATVVRPRRTVAYAHIAELGPSHVESCPTVRLIRDWAALVTQPLESRIALAQDVPLGMAAALCTVSDDAAVPALRGVTDALGLGPGSLQYCVARALRNIHTQAALPELARFLDSPDPEIQYLAVGGFALFANNYLSGEDTHDGPRVRGAWTTDTTLRMDPARPEFLAHRQLYLDFWRAWWNCRPCRTDEQPPTVGLTSPASGAYLSGTVPMAATASDNIGVLGVRFFARRQGVGPEDTASPYQASWNTNSVADGPIPVYAEARDLATTRTSSVPVMVTVDNTAPTLAAQASPAVLSRVDCAMVPITVNVDAWDAIGPQVAVTLASITCDTSCLPQVDVGGAVFGRDDRQFTLRAKSSPTASRTYSITYSATDMAGNTASIVTTVAVPAGGSCP